MLGCVAVRCVGAQQPTYSSGAESAGCWPARLATLVDSTEVAIRSRLRPLLTAPTPATVEITTAPAWMRLAEARLLDVVLAGLRRPVLVQLRGVRRREAAFVLCDGDSRGAGAEYRFAASARGAAGPPEGRLAATVEELSWELLDGVLVARSRRVRRSAAAALVEELRVLERALVSDAVVPVVLVVVANDSELRRMFPLRWADGQLREMSFLATGGPSIGFIMLQGGRLSPHELVHIALSGRLARAEEGPTGPVPYFIEEALARAIGGTQGRPLDAVPRADVDPTALVARIEQLADRRVGDAARLPDAELVRDVLAGAYRVVLRRCRMMPAGLIEASDDSLFGEVLEMVGESLGLSSSRMAELAVRELATAWERPLVDLDQPRAPGCGR
jgi:hypothetical protein